MPNISDLFLASFFNDVVDKGRQVMQAHLLLTESPVLGFFRIKSDVVLGISGASIVTEPDIVALLSQNERRYNLGIIWEPKVHVTFKTVHHKHSWLLGCLVTHLSWDTIELVNVSIVTDHSI